MKTCDQIFFHTYHKKIPLVSNESEDVSLQQENIYGISDKLVLSGEDFPSDVVNIFRGLANDVEFTNVTLVTDGGKNIKAHKVVLSAFSPFFKNLLVNNPLQHRLLYLRGVHSEDLRSIVDFIYLGQTKVDMEKINQLRVVFLRKYARIPIRKTLLQIRKLESIFLT